MIVVLYTFYISNFNHQNIKSMILLRFQMINIPPLWLPNQLRGIARNSNWLAFGKTILKNVRSIWGQYRDSLIWPSCCPNSRVDTHPVTAHGCRAVSLPLEAEDPIIRDKVNGAVRRVIVCNWLHPTVNPRTLDPHHYTNINIIPPFVWRGPKKRTKLLSEFLFYRPRRIKNEERDIFLLSPTCQERFWGSLVCNLTVWYHYRCPLKLAGGTE